VRQRPICSSQCHNGIERSDDVIDASLLAAGTVENFVEASGQATTPCAELPGTTRSSVGPAPTGSNYEAATTSPTSNRVRSSSRSGFFLLQGGRLLGAGPVLATGPALTGRARRYVSCLLTGRSKEDLV
jgi:hypothetical protein